MTTRALKAFGSWSADRRPLRLVAKAEPEMATPTLDQVMRLMGAVPRRCLAMVTTAPEQKLGILVVGLARFELATPCSQSRCATKLRYSPLKATLWHVRKGLSYRVPYAAGITPQRRTCTAGRRSIATSSRATHIEPPATPGARFSRSIGYSIKDRAPSREVSPSRRGSRSFPGRILCCRISGCSLG